MPENPKKWRGFMFDIETGGLNRRRSFDAFGPSAVQDFLHASKNATTYRNSRYFQSAIDESGRPFQLLEFYGEGLNDFFSPKQWPGFVQGQSVHLRPQAGFELSDFSRRHGIQNRSLRFGVLDANTGAPLTEEGFAHGLFSQFNQRIARGERIQLEGWNGLYDISFLENLTHRYESLSSYQGWFARNWGTNVRYKAAENNLFRFAWAYGKQNPEFAGKYFRMKPTGGVAKSWKDLRNVPFWSVENVSRAFSGAGGAVTARELHAAEFDVNKERFLSDAFRKATLSVRRGQSFDQALRDARLFAHGDETTAASAMETLFQSSWSRNVEADTVAGRTLLGKTRAFEQTAAPLWKNPALRYAALGVAGLAVATRLSGGLRKDRQTRIEGLRHLGMAGAMRRDNTDFGSGWQGLDEESNLGRVGLSIALASSLVKANSWARGHYGPRRLYEFYAHVERKSPSQILSTFGLRHRTSQHLPEEFLLKKRDIFQYHRTIDGKLEYGLTNLGGHIQSLLGARYNLSAQDWGAETTLRFQREGKSPYLRMLFGEERTPFSISFAEKGYLTGSSARYNKKVYPKPYPEIGEPKGLWDTLKYRFHKAQAAQMPRPYREALPFKDDNLHLKFQPLHAREDGRWFQNLKGTAQRETFALTERFNKLLGEVGIGLRPETYKTSTGFVSQVLLRRVAPIAAGFTALKYLDYKLGHAPSRTAWDLYAKTRVAHAELTDHLPGGRKTTDFYAERVPGAQYAPLALPMGGAAVGAIYHYANVLRGTGEVGTMLSRRRQMWGQPLEFLKDLAQTRWSPGKLGPAGIGLLAGAALMLPLLPGMLGSRQTAEQLRRRYSGQDPVEVRSGRWWEVGSTPFRGNRILMSRPHQMVLDKTRAEDISLYGSEEEKWAHNPLLHPLRWLRDPYWLEKKHEQDRPYPITSPAFSNVPLIGPILAATIGKIVKPPQRMHEGEWDGSNYTLFTKQVEPRGSEALAPERPKEEFGFKDTLRREALAYSEMIGLPGFLGRTLWDRFGPKQDKPHVFWEGSREMMNLSRRYYEREMGAMAGPDSEGRMYGYSEPLRRFIQREERNDYKANELQNQMPSWLPNGDQYFHDFHKGDPYVHIPMGFARLPGVGYEELHPELKGLNAEDYPDIEKLRILGDVAPWSAQYKQMAARVGAEAKDDIALKLDYERITDRVRRVKESTISVDNRTTGATEEVAGTIQSASATGFTLQELPGRNFSWSGVSMRASDLTSRSLGDRNQDLVSRINQRDAYLADRLREGQTVRAVVAKGALGTTRPRAVLFAGDENINEALVENGLAVPDRTRGGAEIGASDSVMGRVLRRYAEGVSFSGDESEWNPLRYLPKPIHTKLWQERTPLAQYLQQEVYGTRTRRWDRPIHDMLMPWARGAVHRLTDEAVIPQETQHRRDLDTLGDHLTYLRSLYGMAKDPEHRGKYSLTASRTAIGSNLFGSAEFLPATLPGRERKYFENFLRTTDPEERSRILEAVSPEMSDALLAQWHKEAERIAWSTGQTLPVSESAGRLVLNSDIEELTDLRGKVTRVIDGDSLIVDTDQGQKEVRLANINTPEMDTRMGHVAKSVTQELAEGKDVSLHVIGTDKYDRTVGDVFTDGRRLLNYDLLNAAAAERDVYQNKDGSNQERLATGDYFRARQIAEFFAKRGLRLPGPDSPLMSENIDYEDVKAKIIQWEGLDLHDFNVHDDRAAMLWRKPYLDGAVRELTSGDDRSLEDLTSEMEQAIAMSRARDPQARAKAISSSSRVNSRRVTITIKTDPGDEMTQDIRRNPEEYAEVQ